MSTSFSDDNKAYDKLTKRFPLRPIRNDEQNERAAEVCDTLLDRINLLSYAAANSVLTKFG